MDLGGLGVFRLAQQRLGWLDRRQDVLAQNIANGDTPGYAARDIASFEKVLARSSGAALARTDHRHIAPAGGGALAGRPERIASERSHDGNAVRVEDQLAKVADTEMQHELTIGLYRKYMGLFRIALGRGG